MKKTLVAGVILTLTLIAILTPLVATQPSRVELKRAVHQVSDAQPPAVVTH
jgi:hypothetical protein